ncbi:hypothetical protein GIB67_010175 [Kingdonia uniflora]|uniref:Uncharacterized protein n=1 Tax=Kingdonia uniflora TaxID=39325 RepID=A0A7J7NAM9_9MAGN|nr:hypothetical protein GIB67_010175 [Kingdonia uniflora]
MEIPALFSLFLKDSKCEYVCTPSQSKWLLRDHINCSTITKAMKQHINQCQASNRLPNTKISKGSQYIALPAIRLCGACSGSSIFKTA